MSLEASFTRRIGALILDVDLRVGDEIVAVMGPNGAGKTSLLRTVAGLAPIDSGRITLDGVVLDDPTAGVYVPAARRPVGMVFQEFLLFPFLSARENVAFGLRSRGVAKRDAHRTADEWLARVGLADRADARPDALSGGQAQRVALARAVAGGPRVLLLDEPLAALDAQARAGIRRDLRRHLGDAGGARLLVTHDAVDASVLADRVVVLEHGRIVQTGPMRDIALRPRSAYVADLVGLNLYRGTARSGAVEIEGGGVILSADHAVQGAVCVTVHPRAVGLHLDDPHGSARNHWPGTVVDVDTLGDRVRVRIEGAVPIVAEVTEAARHELRLAPGVAVVATVKATEVSVYPA
ncbi:MAG: ABC transporter ATP-binding protein [Actinomycetota bacterium]